MKVIIYIALTTLLAIAAKASTYKCESSGNEDLRKGEVITKLVKNPKEKCVKIDSIEFDAKRGTLKNLPKD